VCPEGVGGEVGGVEVGLGGIEDHAMDARVRRVGVVLDVFVQGARGGDGEDVAYARVLVERVAVDCVGWLAGREVEDCAGVCFRGVGVGCSCFSRVSPVTSGKE
jgi:hypothetical protein